MRRSPTLEAFRLIVSRPAFGLAEIGWRWSFSAAAWLLSAYTLGEYFNSLTVTSADMFLMRSNQMALISQALLHIFHGSGGRLLGGLLILFSALSMGWVVIASLGRAATLPALRTHFPEAGSSASPAATGGSGGGFRALLGLNFLRAAVLLATFIGVAAAILLGGMVASKDPLAIRTATQFSIALLLLVMGAGYVLNWFLSLASVFAVPVEASALGRKPGAGSAILAAGDFCHDHFVGVLAINIWFGFAHLAAMSIAGTLLLIPISGASLLPGVVFWASVLLIALLYFAMADFLHVGRLAAYVCLLESPEPAAVPSRPTRLVAVSVDKDELILSDLGLQPEPGAV